MPINKLTDGLAKNNPLRSVREKKQNRLIIIGFLVTAILIVGFTGYALVYEFLIKNRIPVAQVNHVDIDNTYFQERVKLERYAYIQQYQSLNAQYQFFAEDENTSQYFINQLLQMRQILDNYEVFGETILNSIINDELVAQQALEMGVEISDEEMEQTIQQIFAYYPDGTPTPQPIPTIMPTPTLSRTQEALLSNIPASDSETELSGTGQPDMDDSENEESSAPTPTSAALSPTETPSPTATPYTEELFQETFGNYIDEIELVGVSEGSLRKYIHNFLLNQKVRDEVVKDVPITEEQVWARHILVESSEEALDVLERLDNNESWEEIASEVSLDTSNKDQGGDLGWFPRGRMVAAFEEVAYDLGIGEISDPVETQFGWHIIQVIGHDTLALSSIDYQNAQEAFYQEWLSQIREESEIVINDVWKDIVPTQPVLPF